ncbi:hypothetical protein CANCADRAFT_42845 [Tortispora caseinolytica NRRL Y-17796]|uniref:Ubiquitin-like domain-containing protein n=1 Tax=Tortispora caseinolytica NRRL Y-17796 TaxID=767744 RepID=A0A1E4TKE3_9ASCO|nr:hypothetical protein CANCADRAFT_42845 [Tortispora caseinolytica NRRL Y-17796]
MSVDEATFVRAYISLLNSKSIGSNIFGGGAPEILPPLDGMKAQPTGQETDDQLVSVNVKTLRPPVKSTEISVKPTDTVFYLKEQLKKVAGFENVLKLLIKGKVLKDSMQIREAYDGTSTIIAMLGAAPTASETSAQSSTQFEMTDKVWSEIRTCLVNSDHVPDNAVDGIMQRLKQNW